MFRSKDNVCQILYKLPDEDLKTVEQTCKRAREIISDNTFWLNKCIQKTGLSAEILRKHVGVSWRFFYHLPHAAFLGKMMKEKREANETRRIHEYLDFIFPDPVKKEEVLNLLADIVFGKNMAENRNDKFIVLIRGGICTGKSVFHSILHQMLHINGIKYHACYSTSNTGHPRRKDLSNRIIVFKQTLDIHAVRGLTSPRLAGREPFEDDCFIIPRFTLMGELENVTAAVRQVWENRIRYLDFERFINREERFEFSKSVGKLFARSLRALLIERF